MYEETMDKEFGVDISKVFESKKRSQMSTKPKNKRITNKKMVDAIINLENGLHQVFAQFNGLDHAFRSYLEWSGDKDKFSKFLMEQQTELLKEHEKNGKPSDPRPESSGGNSQTSPE